MNNKVTNVKQIWREGKSASNAWLTIPNSWTSEIIANVGFDCVTIDMQHGLADYQIVLSMLQSISSTDAFPIVRVPWNDPAIIMKVLDAGAMGIICPMVNTEEEAKLFVGACRYPPIGYRSLGPIRANLIFDGDYFAKSNSELVTLAMIETVEAVINIDAILSVEGLDGIYIGTMDLSVSLGIDELGELSNPVLRETIDKILTSVKKHGLIAGMHTRSIEEVEQLKRMGISLVTSMNDSRLLQAAAESVFEFTKNTLS